MTLEVQQQVLALIDFFANAIAQGIPEMNMPFEFKTVPGWEQVLLAKRVQGEPEPGGRLRTRTHAQELPCVAGVRADGKPGSCSSGRAARS